MNWAEAFKSTKSVSESTVIQKVKAGRCTQPREDKQLKPEAFKALWTTLENAGEDHKPSSRLVEILLSSVAPTTANAYTKAWLEWVNFTSSRASRPLPAKMWELAEFLASSSEGESSIANSAKRLAAVNLFHRLVGMDEPGNHSLTSSVMAGITRKLSKPPRKSDAVSREDIINSRKSASDRQDWEGATTADYCLIMYEAQLRHDDIASILVGDIVWTKSHITLVIAKAKTDRNNQGQTATVAVSQDPDSGYQRLIKLLRMGFNRLGAAPRDTRAAWNAYLTSRAPAGKRGYIAGGTSGIVTLPAELKTEADKLELQVENLPLVGSWTWAPALEVAKLTGPELASPTSYFSFLANIKRIFAASCPGRYEHIGAHSFRRGGTNELIDLGMEQELVQRMGRWRAASSLSHYIEDQTSARTCTQRLSQLKEAARARDEQC